MSKMKRVLAVFLALLMVVTCFPVDALAERTENSTQVQAGEGEVSFEGTNSFGSLLSEEINEQESENTEDSKGYDPGYSITNLMIENGVATVEYESLEEAVLVVALYDELKPQMVTSGQVVVSPESTYASVTIEGSVPKYFYATAYLMDIYDYSPLCLSYDTPIYTKEMQELRLSTINDYEADRVLNLDNDNTTNFAVYTENTIVLEPKDGVNKVVSVDDENATYIIENADKDITELQQGEIIAYPYAENEVLIVKVNKVDVDGTTATIIGDELEMTDVFDVVKIEVAGSTSDAIVDESASDEGVTYEGMMDADSTYSARIEDGTDKKKELEFTIYRDFDVVGETVRTRLSGKVNVTMETAFSYYLTVKEQYMFFKTDNEMDFKVSLSGRLLLDGLKLGEVVFNFLPAISIKVTPTVIIRAEVKINVSLNMKCTIGCMYSNGPGLSNISTQPILTLNNEKDSCIEGKIFFGFDLKPKVTTPGIELISLTLYVPVGAQFVGKMTGTNHDKYVENADVRHICGDCLDVDISVIGEVKIRFQLFNSKKFIFELKIAGKEIPVGDMYYSFDFEEFGFGECPHLSYRLTVSVDDGEGAPVSGASVKTGDQGNTTNSSGITSFFVLKGTHSVTAANGDQSASATVMVSEPIKISLSLSEKEEEDVFDSANIGEITDNSSVDDKYYNNHRYRLVKQAMNWLEAKEYCETLGGYLVTISSEGENNFVKSMSFNPLFIGFTDAENEGTWRWVTGEPVTYTNWKDGEPNNQNNEDYALLNPSGVWNDGQLENEDRWFVCEWGSYEKDIVEEASYTESEEAPTLDAIYGGDYTAEKADTYTLKTASFKALVPEQQYILLALKNIEVENPLAADNLLYIDQDVALEDGTLSFQYVQRENSEVSYVVACGASNKNLSDAKITFPEMMEDGDLQAVNPTVVYDDETLVEGKDYVIAGNTSFIKAGTYMCYIRGIRNYTGFVECTYTVTTDKVEIASGWSGDTTWTLTDDGVLTFIGEGAMKNYTYKSEMPWYEYLDQITSVVIKSGVTRIGSYAFYGAPKLESITIPDSVTVIGSYAFKNAVKLNNVVLPSGLTKLGEAEKGSAFYGCTALTSIEIPTSLWTIQPYTFKNCTALTEVKFNEGNLQKISDGAFYNTGLTKLVLPDCLDILDVYAFKNCAALADITIGSGLTELREAVFYGTAIDTITIPEGITKIGSYAFKNCVKLETMELPFTLTNIGEASFYACTALKAVELPDAVTAIGNYAFRKCAAIENLILSAELVAIGECSFYGCTGLTGLVIPDKVTTIKPYAFKTCTGLTDVTLGSKVATIGEGAFNTCTGLKTLVFPVSLKSIGDYAFSGGYNLWQLTFTGDAPAIGTGALKGLAATVYYPGDNATWTSEVMLNYGGKIIWKANE